MTIPPSVKIEVGDTVAVHGKVEYITFERDKVTPMLYTVRFPVPPHLVLRPREIARLVAKHVSRGDTVLVIRGPRAGKVGHVLATDPHYAFLSSPGEEPYGVPLFDIAVLKRMMGAEPC